MNLICSSGILSIAFCTTWEDYDLELSDGPSTVVNEKHLAEMRRGHLETFGYELPSDFGASQRSSSSRWALLTQSDASRRPTHRHLQSALPKVDVKESLKRKRMLQSPTGDSSLDVSSQPTKRRRRSSNNAAPEKCIITSVLGPQATPSSMDSQVKNNQNLGISKDAPSREVAAAHSTPAPATNQCSIDHRARQPIRRRGKKSGKTEPQQSKPGTFGTVYLYDGDGRSIRRSNRLLRHEDRGKTHLPQPTRSKKNKARPSRKSKNG